MPIADKKPKLPAFTEPPAPELPVELPQTILASSLKPLTPQPALENGDLPDWLTDETDDSDFLTAECPSVKPARASLFPALTQRGILGAALMVRKPGKNINISALIAELVKGRIPQQMPFHSDTTLERGCQLLLDYSDSMTPFWEDLSARIIFIRNTNIMPSRKKLALKEAGKK